MRIRAAITVSFLCGAALTAFVSPANAKASEQIFWLTSDTSPEGGWAASGVFADDFGTSSIRACDRGNPDGLRAVTIISWGSYRKEVQDATGSSDSTCASGSVAEPLRGQVVEVQSCLRNRATGRPQFCRVGYYTE
ncbi:hypothetical protein ACFVH6_42205 [Spirillospora sp. NPDC127200]